ncbi:MAG: hypothetical protein IPJ61_06045 [Tessaracoccus sp.]|uniref:hypothetical protein n=1 Tax=Tessaracoccus sp. TaxID=1971211 RepID=UPI001ED4F9F4|nr:hypothetical protein [Tessaracoccus sp.]MBK7820630.1 hypothetical protein [Tessaracoccus sp.]
MNGEAEDSERYLVHAICQGGASMSYVLRVDGVAASSSEIKCGVDTVSSAFVGPADLVEIELTGSYSTSFEALAEVVPER